MDSERLTGQPAWPAQEITGSVSNLVSRKGRWQTPTLSFELHMNSHKSVHVLV